MQALVISEDADQRDFTAYVLRRAGLAVAPASALRRVAETWLENPVDLVVALGGQPDELMAGVTALRAVTEVPILLLLETPVDSQVAALLASGSDLVLPLPVAPQVLMAYAHALMRRSGGISPFTFPPLDLGDVVLDPSARTVKSGGREPQRLTQLEFRLLHVLMTNRDQVIPSEAIVERVWGYTGTGSRELVRNLISRLRSKIEPDPGNPRFILTVSGLGYQFVLPQAD